MSAETFDTKPLNLIHESRERPAYRVACGEREGSRLLRRPTRAEGFAPGRRVSRTWGSHMKLINSFLANDRGSSSTRLALMIGLSSSAILVLVRIGVAVAGQ